MRSQPKSGSGTDPASTAGAKMIVVGRLGAAHGVRGWIRLMSFTENPEDIFKYTPWGLRSNSQFAAQSIPPVAPKEWRSTNKGFLVHLADVNDRDAALELRGTDVIVSEDVLPALESGTYYWRDLIGLRVMAGGATSTESRDVGTVDRIFDTGANDVMVIRRESGQEAEEVLIPCTGNVIVDVDFDARVLTVDWEVDIEVQDP